ncbi:hypothetical protein AHAS_Ahas08G0083800 [Arachis hypogaea]
MEVAAIMAIALANGGGKPPDWQDFVGIITFLVINSTISFIEENNAGNAAAALMARLAPKAKVKLSGSISSQYLTALLMAAPLTLGDVEIEIIDKLISVPYVDMSLKLMERFGVHVEHSGNWDRSPGNAFVEGDASSASYFLAGATVTGGTITVVGCGTSSLQVLSLSKTCMDGTVWLTSFEDVQILFPTEVEGRGDRVL